MPFLNTTKKHLHIFLGFDFTDYFLQSKLFLRYLEFHPIRVYLILSFSINLKNSAMKKKLPASLILPQFLIFRFSLSNFHSKISSSKTKLSLLFFFICFSMWAQHPPFNADGTILVPAGVLTMNVEGWGAGGAGGGASASTALTGRSGAGGGGGAYAKGIISVTAGATLSVKVAQTTAGGSGSGANGGNSYIQGYDTVFLAAGGSGGPANSTGGSPAGGAGGSATVSKGSITTTAGSDGGAGATALLNLLAGSGAGGKGGGTGGGAGGLAAGSVLLGVGPGQPGSPPGGGGSGGLHLSGSPGQVGGNGAAGRVNVTYTCPTYSVSNLQTLVNACTSVGTAKLRLTGTNLPVGIYVVTYNRTNPAGTLTAPMTVTSAGTGDFDVVGLTIAGTSTITVTGLASGVCTNTVTVAASNVTVSPPSVGGTIAGSSTICSGANSGSLILSGHTGTVQKWQYAFAPFTTWVDIPSTAGTGFVFGPLTQTTRFRAVVASGTCVAAISSEAIVTVNPLPTIALASTAAPVCITAGAQTTALTYSATTNSPTTYSIVWNTSPANTFAAVTDQALQPGSVTLAIPSGTAAGTYTGTLTVKNANGCVSVGSPFSVTVNPLPTIALASTAAPVCITAGAQTTSLTYSATTNSPTTYSIVWNTSPANTFAAVTDQALQPGSVTLAIPSGTAAGTYTGTLTVKNANGCVSAGSPFSVTVNPLPTITLASTAAPVCITAGAQTTALTYSATTNSPTTYSIVWNTSPANTFAAVTDQALQPGSVTLAIPSGTAAGTYTGTLTVKNANGCVSAGSPFSVTVNPLPTIALASTAAPVCITAGAQTTSLTYSATTNSPTTYSIVWNTSPVNTFAAVTDQALQPGSVTLAIPSGTAAGTYTGTLTVKNANGCVSAGSPFSVTVNPLPTITLASTAAPVCITAGAQTTALTYSATTNSPTTYSIVWNTSPANTFATVTDQALQPGSVTLAIPSGTAAGTYTGTLTVKNANGCVSAGSPFSVTVNPLPQGSLTSNGPFCGTSAGQLTFTASAGTGPYTIVYTENGGPNITATGIASGTGFIPFTSPINSSTTYVLVSVTDAFCTRSSGFTNGTAVITINPKPDAPVPGTVVQPTCVNPSGSITLNGLIPSVTWTIRQSNGTVQQIYTGSTPSFTVSNLAPGIYTFTVEQISSCPSLPTAGIEIFAPVTNTWNGTAWSKGSEPLITDAIRFSGNYSTTGNLNGCSCTVDPGVNVTVNSNHTLTITNAVNNNGGTLTFENNSSLLQTANAVNTGNIIYKRNTLTRRYDYTYWSSPIVRTPIFTLHDLSPGTLADKYTSYNPNASWVIHYNGNIGMIPGQGYSVRGPQYFDIVTPGTQTATFVGVPNNGTIPVALVGIEKWNLIGNPYPSAIYADQFIFDNADNLYGTLYFWTHNTTPGTGGTAPYKYNSADYAIYNITGSVLIGDMDSEGAESPGNQTAPSGYIAAGQAFFALSKTNPSAIFTNTMRVPGNNSQFFKTTANNKTNLERHRAWINLTNTEGAFKQLLVGYIEGATNSWDHNYDGISLNGNPYLDFYSINEGQNLVIQGRALPFDESDIVPLGYRSAIVGEFTIAIDHTDGVLSNHAIYLEDKVTNTVHNLQNSNYKFTTAIGTFNNRFVLRYTNGTLGVDDFQSQNNSLYASVKDKNIRLNSDVDLIKEVSIFDISGKLLYNNKKVDNNELQISNFQSGNQVLILKVTLENGKIETRKIVFN